MGGIETFPETVRVRIISESPSDKTKDRLTAAAKSGQRNEKVSLEADLYQ